MHCGEVVIFQYGLQRPTLLDFQGGGMLNRSWLKRLTALH